MPDATPESPAMLPSLPCLEDYDISPYSGFLPEEPPLGILEDPYYSKWEDIVRNLQALLLSKRLEEIIQNLPVITTSRLRTPPQWRRAYVLLSFMTHAYIWGGDKPEERVPPSISIPFIQVCRHLELPTVATYSGVCLWNWKPVFDDEPWDSLSNLSTLHTFTGALDESWFYLISIAIEARGGPLIPIMLQAIRAARNQNTRTVIESLHAFAERLDELGALLMRMYENNDPHVFYHRIRPFLSGSKNMADAGLPRGVIFDTGTGRDKYVQYGGGSNAQSSLIQFLDIVLGVEHRPTGTKALSPRNSAILPSPPAEGGQNNFIHDMRTYMPGPHRRFLEDLSRVANIRPYVEANRGNKELTIAYDASLAMLRSLRDKHMQMVSRYIVVKSHESKSVGRALSPTRAPMAKEQIKLAYPSIKILDEGREKPQRPSIQRALTGTGGSSLIPFLKQARDETSEKAIDDWWRRTLRSRPGSPGLKATTTKAGDSMHGVSKGSANGMDGAAGADGNVNTGGTNCVAKEGEVHVVGLSGVWRMDDCEGGICHW